MKVVFIRQEVKVNEEEEGYNIYRSNLVYMEDISINKVYNYMHSHLQRNKEVN